MMRQTPKTRVGLATGPFAFAKRGSRALFLAAAVLLFTANGEAREHCKPKPIQKPCDAPCPPRCKPYCLPVCFEKMMPQHEFSIFGSFLYWTAKEDGLEYAMSGAENSVGVPPSEQGRFFRPDFSWDPGYRLGALYLSPCDWDLSFTWTQFSTRARGRQFQAAVNEGVVANPIWSIWAGLGGFAAAVNLSAAEWRMKYWTIELMTGLPFYPRKNFTLHPAIGIIGARINQGFDVTYTADGQQQLWVMRMNNRFSGVGMKGALDTNWMVNQYLDFRARAAAGLLFGSFDVRSRANSSAPFVTQEFQGTLTGQFLNTRNNPDTAKPEVDFSAGFCFHLPFLDNQYRFSLNAQWNLIIWLEQNQFLRYVGVDSISGPQTFRGSFIPQHGDLFIQGLDLSFSFEF